MKNEAATVHQNPTFLESLTAWPLHPYPSQEGAFLGNMWKPTSALNWSIKPWASSGKIA